MSEAESNPASGQLANRRPGHPVVQIRPLTVTEWAMLKDVLRDAALIHQALIGVDGRAISLSDLPATFASVVLAVQEAHRA